MQLMLSNDETVTLRNVIRDHLPELRRQVAAVELPGRELREELHKRIALLERIGSQLGAAPETAAR